jgi:acyl-CoA synthetase (AMP-forming)/AMP-acid ligase II
LPFYLPTRTRRDATALVLPGGRAVTYRDLPRMLGEPRRLLESGTKALVAIFADRDPDSVAAYLACLSLGHACGFFGPLPHQAQDRLVRGYQPEFVVHAPGGSTEPPSWLAAYEQAGLLPGGAVVSRRQAPSDGAVAADLALLLATSGSTGRPTVARLSWSNLESNAAAIVEALEISPADRAVTSLPLSHCYGLSVLNSHLRAGASVVISADPVLSTRFWQLVSSQSVTSFAGVPVIYQTLHGRRFDPSAFPALTTLTHSGGPLVPDLARYFGDRMESKGGQFWLMYGQTEATARITCLPPSELRQQSGSVGRVIPGGRLWIEDADGAVLPDGEPGAVRYCGPGVMLGYADSRADLGRGDVLRGRLATGDLGYLRDGFLYLTGRVKRIVKVLGFRVGLDEIEAEFGAVGAAAAVRGQGETIVVFTAGRHPGHDAVLAGLLRRLGLPPGVLTLRPVGDIPATRSGKPDYEALHALAIAPPATGPDPGHSAVPGPAVSRSAGERR